jgi:hypothetical protein
MLIDSFAESVSPIGPDPTCRHYLLIDGAFVPGLHRNVAKGRRILFFESLPGCSNAAKDVSPFLTRFEPEQKKLLRLCDRWPMISLIETPESLEELSERLSAWCVVEVDGQRFNFRFADTRRLPAIYQSLNATQRGQFAGPAVRWFYIARNGDWRTLVLDGRGTEIASNPTLDPVQFASLVDDSRADEILRLLRDRGHDVYRQPSRSHALLETALRTAAAAHVDDDGLMSWCKWFWEQDQLHDLATAGLALNAWRTSSI